MTDAQLPGWSKKTSAEFAGRVHHEVSRPRPGRFALLLGAGASASSGIPVAKDLVEDWLVELHDQSQPGASRPSLNRADSIAAAVEWAQQRHPELRLDPDALGGAYSAVIKLRHESPEARQRTFHELCAGKRPGFAYAAIALLMAGAYTTRDGGHAQPHSFNVALTTNFDDLLTVALYLWGGQRPLVINHDGLAGFVSDTNPEPTVIHLHGAYQLDLRNTAEELVQLQEPLASRVRQLLSNRDIIVIGYGGHDQSVINLLASLDDYKHTVWWLSRRPPNPSKKLADWLNRRTKVWVPIESFDSFAFALSVRLGISIPDEQHTAEYLRSVSDQWSQQAKASDTTQEDRKRLALRSEDPQRTVYDVILAASAESDPERADEVWRRALTEKRFEKDARLLGNYAIFAEETLHDYDRAAEFYERAITADPDHVNNLGNYATFLTDIRSDDDRAEELYERAIIVDPFHANNLGNYATFLTDIRNYHSRAEELYERAIIADPNDANILGNYANFLTDIRSDNDRAEELYERTIAADPHHANNLGNYAVFVKNIREDYDRAEELYERAITADPDDANTLGNYALFAERVREDYDRAEELYERAITADPDHANNLTNYALFAERVREDHDRAEELRRRLRPDDEAPTISVA